MEDKMVLAVVGTNALYFMLIVVAGSAANHAFRNVLPNGMAESSAILKC